MSSYGSITSVSDKKRTISVSSMPAPVFSRQSSVLSGHQEEDIAESPVRKKGLTKRQLFVVISMSLFYFTVMCTYSMIAPFFPTEAKGKKAGLTVIGLIFAVFPLVVFIFSPVVGWILPKVGSKFMLLIGLFIEGVTLILFGFVDMMPDGKIFIIFCFLIRVVCGLGSASTSTSSMAIMTENFSENIATAMGLLETFGGLGLMVGPPIGGFLYAAGGFRLPFLVLGGLVLASIVPVYFILPHQRFCDLDQDFYGSQRKRASPLVAYKNPSILMVAAVVAVGGTLIAFLDPTLAIHLKHEFHLSDGEIGLMFVIAPGVYTILAPIFGYVADRGDTRMMMFFGAVLCGVSLFILGPSPLLSSVLPNKLWLNGVSLALAGVGIAPFIIPSLADMHKSAKRAGMPDNLETHGVISGIFNAMFNVGGIIGPTAAGSFAEKFGFPTACTILAIVVFATALILMVYTIVERQRWRKRNEEEDAEREHLNPTV